MTICSVKLEAEVTVTGIQLMLITKAKQEVSESNPGHLIVNL